MNMLKVEECDDALQLIAIRGKYLQFAYRVVLCIIYVHILSRISIFRSRLRKYHYNTV